MVGDRLLIANGGNLSGCNNKNTKEEIIIETWKDIKGYEGIYQASSYGRIRSLDRYIVNSKGKQLFKPGKDITLIPNSDGYLQFKLCRDGSYKTVKVHQIVANTFILKPDDGTYEVNHIDCNRSNNRVENLEWVTHKDNILYSIEKQHHVCTRDLTGANNPNFGNHKLSEIYASNPLLAKEKLSRPESQNGRAVKLKLYDKDMNYIDSFDWIGACAQYLIDNGYTKAKIDNIRTHIGIAMKNNTLYL